MITLNFNSELDEGNLSRIFSEICADPMGGWVNWPRKLDMEEFERVKKTAQKIRDESECLVCIGIGGSYLGHRAIIEALRPKSETEVLYAGNSLSKRELEYALEQVGDRDFSVNVISKSGTTLETSAAFKAFREKLIDKYGKDGAYKRIYATTDANVGMLHNEAVHNNYGMFTIPDNIGGRYSVLTSVGLLPMAVAGVDIDKLMEGAAEATQTAVEPASRYANMRYTLGRRDFDTEVFASFEPSMMYFNEWLKQLFGESEGKNKQGIFPASVIYSTDLHSMGQFMQDGRRNLFETIINVPTDSLNQKVVTAVMKAHTAGGIPVLAVTLPTFDEKGFGELIYFFELACAISAKLFGVNPFDQPGVEAYKAELKELMYAD